jgi:hypothetical protein
VLDNASDLTSKDIAFEVADSAQIKLSDKLLVNSLF